MLGEGLGVGAVFFYELARTYKMNNITITPRMSHKTHPNPPACRLLLEDESDGGLKKSSSAPMPFGVWCGVEDGDEEIVPSKLSSRSFQLIPDCVGLGFV